MMKYIMIAPIEFIPATIIGIVAKEIILKADKVWIPIPKMIDKEIRVIAIVGFVFFSYSSGSLVEINLSKVIQVNIIPPIKRAPSLAIFTILKGP